MRQFWMMLAGVVFAGTGFAMEKSQFAGDASQVAPVAPAMGGDCDSLTSMRGNGRVRIGGEVIVDYTYSRVKASYMKDQNLRAAASAMGEDPDAVRGWGRSGTFMASEWQADTADLDFEIQACDNGKLFISLDLTDFWNEARSQDDLLQDIYFTLENIGGTGFGLTFGKTEIPFGMDKDVLALHPYLDDYQNTYLNTFRNGRTQWTGDAAGMPYYFGGGDVMSYEGAHSWAYDNRFALIPFYKFNDCAMFEIAAFQDSQYNDGWVDSNGRWNGGSYWDGEDWVAAPKRKTNDPGLSFAARATITPIEDLKIIVSGVTRENRGLKGVDMAGAYTDRMYASSVAFDWNPNFFNKKFNVFGEWQHAWNPEFGKRTSSDDIHAGLSYDLTEAITLYGQYEWLRSRDKWEGNQKYVQMQRALFAAQYKLGAGMYFEAGYQHEWGKDTHEGRSSAYADVIYTAVGMKF